MFILKYNKIIMKSLKYYILLVFMLIYWVFNISNVSAQTYWVADTRTFILNWWNDLWKIIPKGVYYEPRIEYTDWEAVKNQFLNNLYYPWDFYTKRNITPDLIKGDDPYMFVDWKKPLFVTSLEWIKKVLKWYLFAYRKNGDIFWMDAQNFTPAFLTWYKSPNKQSIIIYPIKNKKDNKVIAFVQYPCWNLVCKDTLCTDLKVTPKCWDGVTNYSVWEQCDPSDPKTKKWCNQQCTFETLNCKIYNSKEEIYDVNKPTVKIEKDSNVDIKTVYLDRKEYQNYTDINKDNLEPWIYTLNATAINKFSWKEFLCESTTFKVVWKEYCWDGIVNWTEECDVKDPNNNWSCTATCKFKWDNCSITAKTTKLDTSSKFNDVITIKNTDTTKIAKIEVNGIAINKDTYTFNKNGTYDIKVSVINTYAKTVAICEKKLTYSEKEYCWDGIVNWFEQCDDSNKNNGDGCNTSCKLEQPVCKINKNASIFNEWETYKKYLTFDYKWIFKTTQVNTDLYTSENSFMNSIIKANKCSTKNTVTLTIANPIDPSITKSCSVPYTIKPTEYCWDAIVNNWEQCDINDPITWQFCENSCKFKIPNDCNLVSNTLNVKEAWILVVDTDYYAIPTKATIDWKSYNPTNWYFKLTMPTAWTYQMSVVINNKMDTKKLYWKTCDFNIVVQPDECAVK